MIPEANWNDIWNAIQDKVKLNNCKTSQMGSKICECEEKDYESFDTLYVNLGGIDFPMPRQSYVMFGPAYQNNPQT